MNNKKSVKGNRLSFNHNGARLLVGETAKFCSVSKGHTVCSVKSGGRNHFDFGRVLRLKVES